MQSNTLKAQVNYHLSMVGGNKDDLAFKMDMSRSSLYDKLKDPDKFTLGEFKMLAKIIRMTPEQMIQLINT